MKCRNDDSSLGASPVPQACDHADFRAQLRIASVAWLNDPQGPSTFEEPQRPQHLLVDRDALPSEWQGKTSVMVRNIAYNCTRAMFSHALKRAGFENSYDYMYLPIDPRRGTSKGYLFLNFSDDITAYRFKVHFDGKKMDVPESSKLLKVIPANLQGYSENVSHYISKQNELLIDSNDVEPTESHQSNCSDEDRANFEYAHKPPCSREQSFGRGFDGRTMDILGKSERLEVMPAGLQPSSANKQHVMKPGELLSGSKARSPQLPCMDTKPAGCYQNGRISEHAGVFPCSQVQSSCHKCSQCNREMLPGARFCQWCGAQVQGC
eukprot:TRINITY_DN5289_c0_g4_i2.p1 TRINITY_DN5289_c0_g4~~TRINITY_DN5289_c0_g4_i2.p1  ORF type:complete len:347 (+),score=24.67 TRINITY_DN5289_c0_g4_i2:76-1041(+)